MKLYYLVLCLSWKVISLFGFKYSGLQRWPPEATSRRGLGLGDPCPVGSHVQGGGGNRRTCTVESNASWEIITCGPPGQTDTPENITFLQHRFMMFAVGYFALSPSLLLHRSRVLRPSWMWSIWAIRTLSTSWLRRHWTTWAPPTWSWSTWDRRTSNRWESNRCTDIQCFAYFGFESC